MPVRSFLSIYLFRRCLSYYSLFYATYLVVLCVGFVERKKQQVLKKYGPYHSPIGIESQVTIFLVDEGY